MAYWSVAQTQNFCEHRARHHLLNQGYECYLPLVQKTKIYRHKRVQKTFVLFPRYLFVKIVDRWSSILGTIGVRGMIMNHERKPASVKDAVIDSLRQLENKNGFVTLPEKEEFQIGQRVRVVGGQFAGRIALYDGMTNRQRERVLLELLGQMVPVELSVDSHVEGLLH